MLEDIKRDEEQIRHLAELSDEHTIFNPSKVSRLQQAQRAMSTGSHEMRQEAALLYADLCTDMEIKRVTLNQEGLWQSQQQFQVDHDIPATRSSAPFHKPHDGISPCPPISLTFHGLYISYFILSRLVLNPYLITSHSLFLY